MKSITSRDIRAGFERLGIVGKRVVVHSSLRSFGHVEGGAETVVSEMINSFETILVPGFCWESNAPPPSHDRPEQNGCDYSFYDNWTKPAKPFILEYAGIEPKMGIISQTFAKLPQSHRSDHAWYSWIAYGQLADQLVNHHPWETTHLPLERLAELDGQIVLLGVGISSCTAIHIAEERAGRRPFIRWATDKNGQIKRVGAGGCGKGFDNLMPYCQQLFSETYIGSSRVLTTPLKSFIEHTTSLIQSLPEITRCSDTCIRCRDAILGGAINLK